jgi:hypothetical protein
MIEVLYPDGTVMTMEYITFEEIQTTVGGYVECVAISENGKTVQVLCNENGRQEGQKHNELASTRFRGSILMGPGMVGPTVVLSGKDLLK